MTFGPVATDQICRTLARILEGEYPEAGRIEVSPVDAALTVDALPARPAPTRAEERKQRRRRQWADNQRVQVYVDHNGRCGLCHQPVALDEIHLDHVVPLARGGEDTLDNLQPSHPWCNILKADNG